MSEAAAGGMEAFFTRSQANEGRRLPLTLPNGQPTEHWLQIRSQLCDELRVRTETVKREAAKLLAGVDDAQDRARVVDEQMLEVRVALVAGWSFQEPCTPENVRRLLREAPQISNAIERFAADDRSFFSGLPSSTPGSETKSG